MDKCRVLNFILWVAFCFAKIRLFRVALSLHSFATLRNWLRQPLQSLPRFITEKLEIELNSFSKYITYLLNKKEQKYINTKFYI